MGASVWSLSFSNGFPFVLASGGGEGTVRIWDFAAVTTVGSMMTSVSEPLAVWPTKQTPVYKLRFTSSNLLLGAGEFIYDISHYNLTNVDYSLARRNKT